MTDTFTEPAETAAPETPAGEPAAPVDGGQPSADISPGPEWSGVSQQEWEQTQSMLQQQNEYLQQLTEQAQRQPQFDPYTGQPLGQDTLQPPDPWDPDFSQKNAEYVQAVAQQYANQQMEPILPFVNQAIQTQGREAMQQALEQYKGDGFADNEQTAQQHYQAAEMLGNIFLSHTGGDPNAALQMGVNMVKQIVTAERTHAQQTYKDSLMNGQGQRREPGVNGSGLPADNIANLSYSDIALRAIESAHAAPGNS